MVALAISFLSALIALFDGRVQNVDDEFGFDVVELRQVEDIVHHALETLVRGEVDRVLGPITLTGCTVDGSGGSTELGGGMLGGFHESNLSQFVSDFHRPQGQRPTPHGCGAYQPS